MAAKSKLILRVAVLLSVAGLGWMEHDAGHVAADPSEKAAPMTFSLTGPSAGVTKALIAMPSALEQLEVESSAALHSADWLVADWRQADRSHWIGSRWNSLLSDVVDPLFAKSDGWHFYNPDSLDGFRESVRRPSTFSLAGGLKFSRSF